MCDVIFEMCDVRCVMCEDDDDDDEIDDDDCN